MTHFSVVLCAGALGADGGAAGLPVRQLILLQLHRPGARKHRHAVLFVVFIEMHGSLG